MCFFFFIFSSKKKRKNSFFRKIRLSNKKKLSTLTCIVVTDRALLEQSIKLQKFGIRGPSSQVVYTFRRCFKILREKKENQVQHREDEARRRIALGDDGAIIVLNKRSRLSFFSIHFPSYNLENIKNTICNQHHLFEKCNQQIKFFPWDISKDPNYYLLEGHIDCRMFVQVASSSKVCTRLTRHCGTRSHNIRRICNW